MSLLFKSPIGCQYRMFCVLCFQPIDRILTFMSTTLSSKNIFYKKKQPNI